MERARVESAESKVDAGFVELLRPYHVIQSLYSLNKFTIENGVVVAVSVRYIFTAIVINSLIFVTYYFTLKLGVFDSKCHYIIYLISCIPNAIGYALGACIIWIQRNKNVELILTLQEIYRGMNTQFDPSDQKYKIFTRCSCMFLVAIYVSNIAFRVLCDAHWNWARTVITFAAVVFDVEILQCIFCVKFLSDNISEMTRALNEGQVAAEYYDEHEGNVQRFKITTDSFLKLLINILTAFEMCITIFQASIFLFFARTFTHNLIFVQYLIEWAKYTKGDQKSTIYSYFSNVLGFVMWNVKGLFFTCYFSIMCEKMDDQISKIKAASLTVIEEERNDRFRRMAKNVKRLCEVQYTKFNACGFFTVDATLPLRLLGLVTTYCIVLLQFSFL